MCERKKESKKESTDSHYRLEVRQKQRKKTWEGKVHREREKEYIQLK